MKYETRITVSIRENVLTIFHNLEEAGLCSLLLLVVVVVVDAAFVGVSSCWWCESEAISHCPKVE